MLPLYSQQNQGVLVGNDPADFLAFNKWAGTAGANMATLALAQQADPSRGWSALQAWTNSIPYICAQAKAFMAAGATVLFTIAGPGEGQLENIVYGVHDALLRSLYQQIVAAVPGTGGILTRPWHEANLGAANREVAAMNRHGDWDVPLYQAAFIRQSMIAKSVSPRLLVEWNTNVFQTAGGPNPATMDPGPAYYDVVSVDAYIQKQWNAAGCGSYFITAPWGLKAASDLAMKHGKKFAVAEYGCDSDDRVADFRLMLNFMKGLAGELFYHAIWDRKDVINTQLRFGALPLCGAAYGATWG